jgi:pimeloyl-ACP methyl ester carboxylesterase
MSMPLAAARLAFGGAQRVSPDIAAFWAERLFFTPPRRRASARAQRALATGRRWSVPFGAGQLAAWAWGEGPTALLVHGWGSRGAHMAAFVGPLLAAGFRVVAYDAPAHGLSPGRQTDLPELASALQAVAGAAGPVRILIAHSIGGMATALALQRGLAVDRAVLIGVPEAPDFFLAHMAGRLGLEAGTVDKLRRRVERRVALRWSALDLRQIVKGLIAPVLIVHDAADADVPREHAETLEKAWPGAQLLLTSGLGHRQILKDRDVISRVVAFATGAPEAKCERCDKRVGDWDRASALCDPCALDQMLFARARRDP